VRTLEDTKKKSKEIDEDKIKINKNEIIINGKREQYRRVASEGAMLYFLLIQLYIVNHMYQYSLESFYTFFNKAIDITPKGSESVDNRVMNLRQKIRMTIYEWVARGLFERHKQIFYTQLTLRLMQKEAEKPEKTEKSEKGEKVE